MRSDSERGTTDFGPLSGSDPIWLSAWALRRRRASHPIETLSFRPHTIGTLEMIRIVRGALLSVRKPLKTLVPRAGVEPARPYGQRILSPMNPVLPNLTKPYQPVFSCLAVVKYHLGWLSINTSRHHLSPIFIVVFRVCPLILPPTMLAYVAAKFLTCNLVVSRGELEPRPAD